MADELNLLENVKTALGIAGTYQDNTIQLYIDEVQEYMRSAGVHESIIKSKKSIGVIARGVADLWNYGGSKAELSTYFMQRIIQLSYAQVDESDEATTIT